MPYALRRPVRPLADWIEVLWSFEGVAGPHAWERLLPDGSMELVVNLAEDEVRAWDRRDLSRYERLEGAMLVGAQTEYFVIDTATPQSVMGAHFRPGGAFPFLGMPAAELLGLQVSLRDVWGGFARELRERLLEAESVEARFDVLEAALLQRMNVREQHPAVRFALAAFGGPVRHRVADVTERTGLSARRFIDLFRAQVGMTPKMYCRLQRFQSVVGSLPPGCPIDWAAVALDAGYCDQSHLVHDFGEIAGISPGTWAALRTEHRNHVPIR
jgi:AraC-like DNA-binding protein